MNTFIFLGGDMKKTFILFLLVSLSFSAQAGFEYIPTESGNYCKDQVTNFIYNYFGDNVQIEKMHKIKSGGPGASIAFWVKTNLCDGYIVGETMSQPSCGTPHYGFVPAYVIRFWGYNKCHKLIKNDIYPTDEELGLE